MKWSRRVRTPVPALPAPLPRTELLRRGRVAILDDETPEMLQDLLGEGLAVTHLQSTADPQFPRLTEAFYDVLLLDYGGIGGKFGQDEGLDVLRYLKRVNPSLRILAFTARTFDASKADFFRLCDGIIKKDSGIRETLEHLEFHLSQVLTAAYQFEALKKVLSLNPEDARDLDTVLSKAIANSRAADEVLPRLRKLMSAGSEKLAEALVKKALEFGIAAAAAAL